MESVNYLTFSVLPDYLRCWHKIEFLFQGKQYSITNSQGIGNSVVIRNDSIGSL